MNHGSDTVVRVAALKKPLDEGTRMGVILRGGYSCELCGKNPVENIHHRSPRRMGGTTSPTIHAYPNLLGVCGSGTTGCHGYIESNRRKAISYGWLVPQGTNPAVVPAFLIVGGRREWVLLTHDGRYDHMERRPTRARS